jgi:hypothetical protein
VIYLNGIGLEKQNVVSGVKTLLGGDLLFNSYQGGVTKRPKVDENLFLTTAMPPAAAILQHHEMSYMDVFPSKIFFFCNVPAEHGGATPVAFARAVKQNLNKDIYAQFKRRGITYVRNYFPHADDDWGALISWKTSFEVQTKAEFEKKAKNMAFKYEWLGDQLRTFNRRTAVQVHPVTKEEVLFNHCFVLHTFGEKCPARRAQSAVYTPAEAKLMSELPAMEQPYLATWGDTGQPIEGEIIEEVHRVYNACKHTVDWRKGSLMMIDNILASHGRDPFAGEREILAILAR